MTILRGTKQAFKKPLPNEWMNEWMGKWTNEFVNSSLIVCLPLHDLTFSSLSLVRSCWWVYPSLSFTVSLPWGSHKMLSCWSLTFAAGLLLQGSIVCVYIDHADHTFQQPLSLLSRWQNRSMENPGRLPNVTWLGRSRERVQTWLAGWLWSPCS